MAKRETIIETQEQTQIQLLEAALEDMAGDTSTTIMKLEERLVNLDLMMDEIGWSSLTGAGYESSGPDLAQIKTRSKQIREAMALSPHIKRGSQLRTSYVWSDPITYKDVPGYPSGRVGTGKSDVGARIKDPINKRYIFGTVAREERERSLFSDGMYILLGEDKTKTMFPVPIWEISADYVNPDNQSEIWAYRREWNRWNSELNRNETVRAWYFTDLFKRDHAVDEIADPETGNMEMVDNTHTIIDGMVNTQVGWKYGFPDAGCVIEWARLYSEFMKSGKKMTDAMAKLWAQYKPTSANNGAQSGVKINGAEGSGGVSIASGELTPLSTAGRAYDFKAGVPMLAIVAAGLEVSVVALSASPGDAGSSYGAAATLDLPERLSTQRRREWHIDFDERILRWMGAPDAKAFFPPLISAEDELRGLQAAGLKWNSGLYGAKDAQAEFQRASGSTEILAIPAGVMLPNNVKSLERKDIDTDGTPAAQTGSGQGKSTGSGDIPAAGNTRTDTISK